ncbi:hypothetical protein [Neisseria yangbaofengii]|uniref:hypothetical protein n=1 Tax=Neisseria yangbaofengii TaxID=2709396 RepID=UPI0013ED9C6E|nr:hypothetical protein [Neisseria yangbaofengii]
MKFLLGFVFLGTFLVQVIVGKLMGWENKFDKQKYEFGIRWVFFIISGFVTGLTSLFLK